MAPSQLHAQLDHVQQETQTRRLQMVTAVAITVIPIWLAMYEIVSRAALGRLLLLLAIVATAGIFPKEDLPPDDRVLAFIMILVMCLAACETYVTLRMMRDPGTSVQLFCAIPLSTCCLSASVWYSSGRAFWSKLRSTMATHAIIRIIANSPARHTNQLHLAMLIFEISLVYSLDLKRRQFIASHLASCLPMDLADLSTALAAAAQADTISTDYDAASEHSCDDTISSTDLSLNPILDLAGLHSIPEEETLQRAQRRALRRHPRRAKSGAGSVSSYGTDAELTTLLPAAEVTVQPAPLPSHTETPIHVPAAIRPCAACACGTQSGEQPGESTQQGSLPPSLSGVLHALRASFSCSAGGPRLARVDDPSSSSSC